MSFEQLGLDLRLPNATYGYSTPDHPIGADWQRLDGFGTDRHRQDRRVRAAHLAAAAETGKGTGHGPKSSYRDTDPGARIADQRRGHAIRAILRAHQRPSRGRHALRTAISNARQNVGTISDDPGALNRSYAPGGVDFSRLEVLILDEADRMLDMGFVQPVMNNVNSDFRYRNDHVHKDIKSAEP